MPPRFTAMDEHFVHQIPEVLPNVQTFSHHWRESLFFVMHRPDRLDDVVILTMATYPARGEMDAFQLGRVGGQPAVAFHARPYGDDPHTMAVGPVTIDIVEPLKRVHLQVAPDPSTPLSMDIRFDARTQAHALRRGTMKHGSEVIWDQSHMIQSGHYSGWFEFQGERHDVDGWWGQRDHSWGVRDHARVPLWIWLAIQLPDGMAQLWHWELANGARIYTDGCWAPADGSDTTPVIDCRLDLHWTDDQGREVSYGRDGEGVAGVAGRVELVLEGGRVLGLEAEGRWAQPYGGLGGGLNEVVVRADDGRQGTAIYELTGSHHHRYFPVPRAEDVPE